MKRQESHKKTIKEYQEFEHPSYRLDALADMAQRLDRGKCQVDRKLVNAMRREVIIRLSST